MLLSKKEFKQALRDAAEREVFVHTALSNGNEFYFSDYEDWFNIKSICEDGNLSISKFALQFRSHVESFDVDNAEAVYFVRSVMGQVGQQSKEYFTVGALKRGVVHKKMWLKPELIVEKEYEDTIENCFEEAIIYNDEGKNR
jgi:hypothetical protein